MKKIKNYENDLTEKKKKEKEKRKEILETFLTKDLIELKEEIEEVLKERRVK